ncbi:MAG: hypothetical protein FWG79_05145 [Bacteroidales bacterium]|nr:hypothetical protein [Bacteroidales bacterium]
MEKKTLILSLALFFGAFSQAQRLSVIEQEARNVYNRPGYIIKKNGTKVEGSINIKYFETAPSTIIIGLRTAVSVSYTVVNKKGKAKNKGNTFRPKHVQYFVVFDERGTEHRYEPVNKAIVGNLMSSTSLDLDARKPYFQRVVYANGEVVAYFDPSSEDQSTDFTIVKKRGDKAILFSELLRNGKTTQSFIGDCLNLQIKLEEKQFSNNEESLREFVDLFVACQN